MTSTHKTTVAELIEGIRQMDPSRKGLTKLRKSELVALHTELLDAYLVETQPEIDKLVAARNAQHVQAVINDAAAGSVAAELNTTTRWGTDEDEPVVFSNDTLDEDVASEAAYAEFAVSVDRVVNSLLSMAPVARQAGTVVKRVTREAAGNAMDTGVVSGQGTAARDLAMKVFANELVRVRSMGRDVLGTVVDAVLRTPDTSGRGRVLLVVQHQAPGQTRTMHGLHDVHYTS